MQWYLVWGLGAPFLGTVLGSGLVWFLDWDQALLRRAFSGAAAGIMGAASLFALLLPAWRMSAGALAGTVLGAAVLLLPGLLQGRSRNRGVLVALAVVLHNIPEGMATGVSLGSWLAGSGMAAADAAAVALGIALQNIPDGAMVALPLRQQGMSRLGAFALGVLSGAVEPAAAVCMLLWARYLTPSLPVLMGFAAGAMGYVVAVELLPGMHLHRGKAAGAVCFLLGLGFMLWVL